MQFEFLSVKAFALSSMPLNTENCTTREAFGLPFLFESTCRIGRAFNVGLTECKLNSSPINCFTFVLHVSGVTSGITEKILRNMVIFQRMQICNTPGRGYSLGKKVIG